MAIENVDSVYTIHEATNFAIWRNIRKCGALGLTSTSSQGGARGGREGGGGGGGESGRRRIEEDAMNDVFKRFVSPLFSSLGRRY